MEQGGLVSGNRIVHVHCVHSSVWLLHRRQLIATGDALGVVKIWSLNDELTTESAAEREILNALADTSGQE